MANVIKFPEQPPPASTPDKKFYSLDVLAVDSEVALIDGCIPVWALRVLMEMLTVYGELAPNLVPAQAPAQVSRLFEKETLATGEFRGDLPAA